MEDQASQNDRNLRRNIESDQLKIVSTLFAYKDFGGNWTVYKDKYTKALEVTLQHLKIIGTLHHEWKKKNLLGDFDFFMEDDLECPIYRRKTKTSPGSEVFLYRFMGKWRIGPNYSDNNCWLFINSNGRISPFSLVLKHIFSIGTTVYSRRSEEN